MTKYRARDILSKLTASAVSEMGNLMTLELLAPNQRQAVRLGKLFEKKAEAVYNLTMAELLDDEDEADD